MSFLTWKIVMSRSFLLWLLFLQVGVVTAFLASPSTSRLCNLVQGNFSIYCFNSKHSSMSWPWSLWKRQYLFLLRLLGSPFIFSGHFKKESSLICINTCSSGMFKGIYCRLRAEELAFLLSQSFFSPVHAFFGQESYSGWRGRSASIRSDIFLFLAIIASSAFMKFWVEWTSLAIVWGFCS